MDAESKVSIYVTGSRECVLPGVKLLNGLNTGSGLSDSEREKKVSELDRYHEDSQKCIREFVAQLPVCSPICAQSYRWILINR